MVSEDLLRNFCKFMTSVPFEPILRFAVNVKEHEELEELPESAEICASNALI
jgi:hypothetical protein